MGSIISASHDVVFKALFVRNPHLLRAFLREVMHLALTDTDTVLIKNPELVPLSAEGKLSRLDISVETATEKFNIEMQAQPSYFSAERVLYYVAKLYSDDFESGKKYTTLKKSYSINILGFRFLDCESYHSSFSMREDTRGEQLSDKLSVHIFELPKLSKELDPNDEVQLWMNLIRADSEEALTMIRTSTNNPAIQQGAKAILELSADDVLREQIRMRDKAEKDYWNGIREAEDRALNRGLVKGRAEGREEGKEEGRFEERQETRRRFLDMGWSEAQIEAFFNS